MNDPVHPPPRRAGRQTQWFEAPRMALDAIAVHKLRSALTLLGVLVGVFSIIVVMTAMRVLQNNIERELSSLGSETFTLTKWPSAYFGFSGDLEKYWRRKDLTLETARKLAATTTLPAHIGVESQFWTGGITTPYRTSAPTVVLYGETPDSFPARGWNPGEGRLLADADLATARNLCVLGHGLAADIFPNRPALGEPVKINGINYTVVGVLAASGAASGGNQDNFAVAPLTTLLNRYGRSHRSLSILIQARSRAGYDATVAEVRGALRVLRKVPPGQPDDFEIASNDSLIQQFKQFTRSVRLGVLLVSSIALLAAGVGIMNIMLVSVTERTREIGIRRALGATRRQILLQFTLEAVILSELGGAAGVLLGILGGNLLALALRLPPAIPLDWVALGLLLCSLVGIVFGTYPAWQAAHLDPVDSLRHE